MKKTLLLFSFIFTLALTSCNEDEELNQQSETYRKIATISQQQSAIGNSIDNLSRLTTLLVNNSQKCDTTKRIARSNDNTTGSLDDEISALRNQIEELKDYINNTISSKEWLDATYCTLEEYEKTIKLITALQKEIEALKEKDNTISKELYDKIDEQINLCYESMKSWISEYFTGYYDINQTDILIKSLQDMMESADNELKNDIESIKSALEASRTEMTKAYRNAIETAISEYSGYIEDKIAKSLEEINERISREVAEQNKRLDEIDERLKNLENIVSELFKRVQSISYIPLYEDKIADVFYPNDTTAGATIKLDFMISPKNTTKDILKVYKEILNIKAIYIGSPTPIDLPIISCTGDTVHGIISIEASAEILSMDFYNEQEKAMVALHISDGNNDIISEYISVIPKRSYPPKNQFWYTTLNNEPISLDETIDPSELDHIYTDLFGAQYVSHSYNSRYKRFEFTFDNEVTALEIVEFYFINYENINSLWIPSGCTEHFYLNHLDNLEQIHSKYATEDRRCLITDNRLVLFAKRGITEYILPEHITSIGAGVFLNSILSNIVLGNNIQHIEYNAFENCQNLTSVNLTKSLRTIGSSAFKNCIKLEHIELEENIESIGNEVFENCYRIKSITLGNKLQSIPHSAFKGCSNIKEITVPQNIKSIGVKAFEDCSNLTDVYFMSPTPPQMQYDSFDGCSNDLKFHIPDGSYINYIHSSMPSTYKDKIVTDETYPYDIPAEHTMKYKTDDSRIINIKKSYFGNAKVLFTKYLNNEGIIYFDTIPTGISSSAFSDNTNLISIEINKSIKEIGNRAFSGCTNLRDVYFMSSTPPSIDKTTFNYSPNLKLHIPDGSYPNYIRSGWDTEALKMISINDNSDKDYIITYITTDQREHKTYTDQFGDAKILFTYFDGNKWKICFDNKPTVIPEGVFQGWNNLKEITLPNCVRVFEHGALMGCEELEEIVIPDSVAIIEENAFNSCYKLKEIQWGENVDSIGPDAFFDCKELKSITFPDKVRIIKERALSGCEKLESVTFGKNIKFIGYDLLLCDFNLREIRFTGAEPPEVEYFLDLYGNENDIKIYVPNEYIYNYLYRSRNWPREYLEIIRRTYDASRTEQ